MANLKFNKNIHLEFVRQVEGLLNLFFSIPLSGVNDLTLKFLAIEIGSVI